MTEPIKIHSFSGVVNFMQFYSGFLDWPPTVKTVISPVETQYKTYVNACCNKATWLKILKTCFADFLSNNASNTEFWTTIKARTNTDKLMIMEDDKMIYEI